MTGRLLLLTVIVALCASVVASPALAYFSTLGGSVTYSITTAERLDPDEGQVWVCKLTGPPDEPRLARGENPIEVAPEAITDDHLNDQHHSPVVEEGTDCDEVWPPDEDPDTRSQDETDAEQTRTDEDDEGNGTDNTDDNQTDGGGNDDGGEDETNDDGEDSGGDDADSEDGGDGAETAEHDDGDEDA